MTLSISREIEGNVMKFDGGMEYIMDILYIMNFLFLR